MLKQWLRKFFTGYTLTQEYLCVPYEEMPSDFKVILSCNGEETDVTDRHLFLGYKPTIFGIKSTTSDSSRITNNALIKLSLAMRSDPSKSVATFSLQRLGIKQFGNDLLILFQALHVEHRLLSRSHRLINSALDALKGKAAGNVNLPGNLYDQVRVAYAIPRLISIITLGTGGKMNMFPTDLHGKVSDSVYVGSLRIEGKATAQVERLRKICLSEVRTTFYKEAYSLGKNHMQELKPVDQFPLVSGTSELLGLPIPQAVVLYREMELIKSIDFGIHRIHFYQILNERRLAGAATRLSHVHRLYVQWRTNKGLSTNVLFR